MKGFSIYIPSPYISVEQFAKNAGMPIETVRTMLKDGRLPQRIKDKNRQKPLINLIALLREADEQAMTLIR